MKDNSDTISAVDDQVERLEVTMWLGGGEMAVTTTFDGKWLVYPDEQETRADALDGPGFDAGAYYGVALTAHGRIAVYVAHCNDRWAPVLKTFDSIEEAANEMLPDSIVGRVTGSRHLNI